MAGAEQMPAAPAERSDAPTLKSTPRPWQFDGRVAVYSIPRDGVTMIKDADGVERPHREGLVALIYSTHGDDIDTQTANGRMIQAGPDLAAVLVKLLAFYQWDKDTSALKLWAEAVDALQRAGVL